MQLVEHWKSYCFSCIEFAVLPAQAARNLQTELSNWGQNLSEIAFEFEFLRLFVSNIGKKNGFDRSIRAPEFKCYFRNVLTSLWAVCWKLVSSICTVGRYYRVVWFVGYNSITGCLRSELDCKTLSEPLFIAHMLSIPFFWSAAALPPSFAYPPFTYLCILPSTVLRFSA